MGEASFSTTRMEKKKQRKQCHSPEKSIIEVFFLSLPPPEGYLCPLHLIFYWVCSSPPAVCCLLTCTGLFDFIRSWQVPRAQRRCLAVHFQRLQFPVWHFCFVDIVIQDLQKRCKCVCWGGETWTCPITVCVPLMAFEDWRRGSWCVFPRMSSPQPPCIWLQ